MKSVSKVKEALIAHGAVGVTDCNRNRLGLQSARFRDHIRCIYYPTQDHIICL
jgi:hypothetical protein